MKKLSFLTFLLLSIPCFALEISPRQILAASHEELMPLYASLPGAEKQVFLRMEYGSPVIVNPLEIKNLSNAVIASVEVVYSDHPTGRGFPALTEKRIENLRTLNRELFNQSSIQWRFIRQTSCSDLASARSLFHGLVITYRLPQSEETMIAEIRYLKELFPEAAEVSKTKVPTFKKYERENVPVLRKKYKRGDETVSDELFIDTVEREEISPKTLTDHPSLPIVSPTRYLFPDSTIFKVLKRNRWEKMAIAADLTGSMSPYTAQLLVWFKLNTTDNKVKQFVFFNDGNKTPNSLKVCGKTGGIYETKSAKFEDVKLLAVRTMNAGCGGDGPENNVEALLKTIALCPDCEQLVMIADNWAPVKDLRLMVEIGKPVHIILCGVYNGINPDYLNLARSTGGSVHTMESDLTELVKLHEGEVLTIGRQTFQIIDGKFVLASTR